ncbi:MAG: hypothetical protein HOK98_01490 [Rhodospirillaceae bacterium]|jgi:hypothetical protein|nr:hypothetical protein [Rhodospirillaceae bacterium]MBT6404622.1 hypothetical protein [Rhodospirillaceae bacterium]MBT6534829.1 hypothetical protein [Rhodospirillaceae bacterium]MBT7362857.1 hypothetical protein [Rhodospirillaceae bacterium]
MRRILKTTAAVAGATFLASASVASADGIVAKLVNSPLNSAGLVKGGYSALNVYLQKPGAEGIEFYNPEVPGFGIPAGGHIEVEMVGGFARDSSIAMDARAVHMVSGTPQHGLSDKRLGYQSVQGENPNIFVISAISPDGLPAEKLLPRATVQQLDPIPNIGLKTFHIGLSTIAFSNGGEHGTVAVRVVDRDGKILASGQAEVDFWDAPRPQIHPNNFLHQGRNHNWQRVAPGETVGQAAGSVPLTFLLFEKPTGTAQQIRDSRTGIAGAGVLSAAQLRGMAFDVPASMSRYDSGLIVHDSNGDGKLDPRADQIIGGVITSAPGGDSSFDVRSLVEGNTPLLSQPTGVYSERAGARIGGAIMQVQFTTGAAKGKYRPTFALLVDPDDPARGDGTAYTYTVIAQ